jgi:hypothetical protein
MHLGRIPTTGATQPPITRPVQRPPALPIPSPTPTGVGQQGPIQAPAPATLCPPQAGVRRDPQGSNEEPAAPSRPRESGVKVPRAPRPVLRGTMTARPAVAGKGALAEERQGKNRRAEPP